MSEILILNRDQIFRKLQVSEIIEYLEDKGWKEFRQNRKEIKIYQKISGNRFHQVNVPVNPNLSDYYAAIERVLEEIATSEDKQISEILLYFATKQGSIKIKITKDDRDIAEYIIFNPEDLQKILSVLEGIIDVRGCVLKEY